MKRQSILLLAIVPILVFLAEPAFGALPKYEIIDLDTLGGECSIAIAINDLGQVVGWSDITYGVNHAFLWDSTHGMIDLGTLTGHNYSSALAINDYGVVVGSSDPYGDQPYPFIWDAVNKMRYLDGLFGEGVALGINNSGQVVGCVGDGSPHAFLWDSDSGAIDLGTLGGWASSASAINNAGQVAGVAHTPSIDRHAFIWDSIKGMCDLGTLGGSDSGAQSINNAGQVVGYSNDVTDMWANIRAFLWDTANGMIDLGFGLARGVNNAGQVVGWLNPEISTGPAFYWDMQFGMVKLEELLLPDSRWQRLQSAFDINNRGQIVGEGITKRGAYHAFLMTPVLPTIEVPMKFTPQALNCVSKGKWVKAHLVLPAEFTVKDVDSNSLITVHPLGIEPNYTNISVNEDGLVEIEAAFDRAYFCTAFKNSWFSEETITITGSFISGQYFYGMDTIKIIDSGFKHLAILSSHWLECNCRKSEWCEGTDINQDSVVNFKDFAFMALYWLEDHNP